MKPEHGSGPRHDLRWRVGGLVFATLVVVGSICAALALQAMGLNAERVARQDARSIAQSVAQTLALQLGRAARLGIPLQELPGVEPYLQTTLGHQSVLDAMAVEAPDGTTLYQAGRRASLAPGAQPVRVAIASGAASAGSVVVGVAGGQALQQGQGRMLALAAAAVLGLALCTGLWAALGPGARLEAQRRAALAWLRQGPPADPPRDLAVAEGPQALLQALAQGNADWQAADEGLQAYAQELLAMDFDGQMRTDIERIVHRATATPAAERKGH